MFLFYRTRSHVWELILCFAGTYRSGIAMYRNGPIDIELGIESGIGDALSKVGALPLNFKKF